MAIYTIVYQSYPTFTGALSEYLTEIDQVLATSRRRNAESAVTGAMLFNEDCFVQVLEGPEEAVQATFDRIAADPRHENVEILSHSFTADRHFPNWSMAFVGDANAVRERFADSPLAKASVRLQGDEIVNFMVALVNDNRGTA